MTHLAWVAHPLYISIGGLLFATRTLRRVPRGIRLLVRYARLLDVVPILTDLT